MAPWLYLFGVIAWTWSWLGVAVAAGEGGLFAFPGIVFAALGLLGPTIVPLALVALGYGDPARDGSAAAFLRRAFDPRTLAPRWYLTVFALVAVLAFGPVLLAGGWRTGSGLLHVGPIAVLLLGFAGGIVEEPGWRGYAQEGLQRRMPVVAASLVIGLFWAVWHLPLFFIEGTYQAGLGMGTPSFWAFHAAIVFGSPVYAWLYNAAGGVTFAPLLYHALGNVARELVPDMPDAAEVGVEAGLALVLTLVAWHRMARRAPAAPTARE